MGGHLSSGCATCGRAADVFAKLAAAARDEASYRVPAALRSRASRLAVRQRPRRRSKLIRVTPELVCEGFAGSSAAGVRTGNWPSRVLYHVGDLAIDLQAKSEHLAGKQDPHAWSSRGRSPTASTRPGDSRTWWCRSCPRSGCSARAVSNEWGEFHLAYKPSMCDCVSWTARGTSRSRCRVSARWRSHRRGLAAAFGLISGVLCVVDHSWRGSLRPQGQPGRRGVQENASPEAHSGPRPAVALPGGRPDDSTLEPGGPGSGRSARPDLRARPRGRGSGSPPRSDVEPVHRHPPCRHGSPGRRFPWPAGVGRLCAAARRGPGRRRPRSRRRWPDGR